MAKGVMKFKNTDVARQSGELARVRVIFGTDKGAIHVITVPKVTIGRGEDNEILLPDLKASRKHAEFIFDGAQWGLKDLGSANGLLVNGQLTRQALLRSGDHVQIGESVVEFLNAEASTQMLKAPIKDIQHIQQEHAVLNHHREQVRSMGKTGGSGNAASGAKPANKILKLGLIAALALVVFIGYTVMTTPKKKLVKKLDDKPREPASIITEDEFETLHKTAAPFMREGMRELREKNYLRARLQFETVLQMSPAHPLATLLLQNSITALTEEVEMHKYRAMKTEKIGKYKEAKSHYEAILRLLYRDQSNPIFKESEEKLKELKKDKKSTEEGGNA